MVSKRCWMFLTNQRASCSLLEARGAVALAADRLRVQVVDAQLGHHVGIELHFPDAATALHDDVGHDHARIVLPEGPAGLRIAMHDQVARLAQLCLVGAGDRAELLELATRQQVEVLPTNVGGQRVRRRLWLRTQLQRQALGEAACAHAGRIEALQPLERALQAFEQPVAVGHFTRIGRIGGTQALGDLFQRIGEIAIGIQ
jgi:hypothetical protein